MIGFTTHLFHSFPIYGSGILSNQRRICFFFFFLCSNLVCATCYMFLKSTNKSVLKVFKPHQHLNIKVLWKSMQKEMNTVIMPGQLDRSRKTMLDLGLDGSASISIWLMILKWIIFLCQYAYCKMVKIHRLLVEMQLNTLFCFCF